MGLSLTAGRTHRHEPDQGGRAADGLEHQPGGVCAHLEGRLHYSCRLFGSVRAPARAPLRARSRLLCWAPASRPRTLETPSCPACWLIRTLLRSSPLARCCACCRACCRACCCHAALPRSRLTLPRGATAPMAARGCLLRRVWHCLSCNLRVPELLRHLPPWAPACQSHSSAAGLLWFAHL